MHPILLLAALLTAPNADPVVAWKFKVVSIDQGLMAVELIATIQEGWHMYSTTLANDDGPVPTTIHFTASDSYKLISPLVEPTPEEVYDPNFSMQVRYHSNTARFIQRLEPKGTGSFVLKGEVEYMVCNDKTCLPPTTVSFVLDVPDRELKP